MSIRDRVLDLFRTHTRQQYRIKDIQKRAGIAPRDKQTLKDTLHTLVDDGVLTVKKGGRYALNDHQLTVTGKLTLTQKGFGFVLPDDDTLPDIFIGRRQLGDAIHGDQVKVRIRRQKDDRYKGRIVDVVQRATDRFIGTAVQGRSGWWLSISPVTPERGFRIRKKDSAQFRAGDIIVTSVIDWGTPTTPILVGVERVIGDSQDPKNDFEIILEKYDYRTDFPPEVMHFVDRIDHQWIEKEIPKREDLRKLPSVTIDPRDARDFDDAVSLEKRDNGYRLGVHIADVSHFVSSGSPGDREALNRATSVYFSEGVVNMLPEKLSADICSLRPGEDRLTMSALIDLNADWTIRKFRVTPSVIRSQERFTYEQVQAILDGEQGHPNKATLQLLEDLSCALFKRRSKQGSIDFDIPEPIFSLDEAGIPHEIRPSERLQSHRIVEECMLLANRLVAEHFGTPEKEGAPFPPFVFRIHDQPKEEKTEPFLILLKRLGLAVGKRHDPGTSKGMRDLLAGIEDSPHKGLIESVALRTMAKAIYSTKARGHFGLAFDHYTHFTSPIRRYADLVVHRLIKQRLKTPGKQSVQDKKAESTSISPDGLTRAIEASNTAEQTALQAEREYIKIKQLRWLNEHLDEEFTGIISGVLNIGFFVELDGSFAEGLVHIDSLEYDDYIYDEDAFCLRGRRTKQEFALGDEIEVRVLSVTFDKQRANFALAKSR